MTASIRVSQRLGKVGASLVRRDRVIMTSGIAAAIMKSCAESAIRHCLCGRPIASAMD